MGVGFLDSVAFVAASSGTVDFVVATAYATGRTPASAGAVDGKIYRYRAQSADGSQWENGYGIYTVSTTTLARTTVTASSNAGAKTSFTVAPIVMLTALSVDLSALLNLTGMGGRLTLSSGTPVMAATVSAAGTVYFTPYNGATIRIYDGVQFVTYQFAELSQALTDATKSPAAAAASNVYDLFVWNDAGTLRCTRGPTWAAGAVAGSNTQRGTGAGSTELQMLNGIWTNKNAITNGPGANLGTYVGTIATNGTSTVDWILGSAAAGGGAAVLNVWNMYNRVLISASVQDSTSSWTYNSTTWRSANASNSNRVTFVRGIDEGSVSCIYEIVLSGGSSGDAMTGIGLDTTSASSAKASVYFSIGSFSGAAPSVYYGIPGLGAHFLQAVERQVTTVSAATYVGVVNSAQTMALSFQGMM